MNHSPSRSCQLLSTLSKHTHACTQTHTLMRAQRLAVELRSNPTGDSQRRAARRALNATVFPQLYLTIAQFPLIYSSSLLIFNCEPSFPPLADVDPRGYLAKTALNQCLWCRFCLSPSTGGWGRDGGSSLKRFKGPFYFFTLCCVANKADRSKTVISTKCLCQTLWIHCKLLTSRWKIE